MRKKRRVFCNVLAYVSCRRYAGISQRVQEQSCEARWHRGSVDSPLTVQSVCLGLIFMPLTAVKGVFYFI